MIAHAPLERDYDLARKLAFVIGQGAAKLGLDDHATLDEILAAAGRRPNVLEPNTYKVIYTLRHAKFAPGAAERIACAYAAGAVTGAVAPQAAGAADPSDPSDPLFESAPPARNREQ
jgi:hypothetical protein